jgi:hypothetical protein
MNFMHAPPDAPGDDRRYEQKVAHSCPTSSNSVKGKIFRLFIINTDIIIAYT